MDSMSKLHEQSWRMRYALALTIGGTQALPVAGVMSNL